MNETFAQGRGKDRRKSRNRLLFGSGQVDRLGNRCAVDTRRDSCGAKRPHERSGVLLQDLTVDVVNRVAGAVIAGIIRATSRAAKQLSLLLRFPT